MTDPLVRKNDIKKKIMKRLSLFLLFSASFPTVSGQLYETDTVLADSVQLYHV